VRRLKSEDLLCDDNNISGPNALSYSLGVVERVLATQNLNRLHCNKAYDSEMSSMKKLKDFF
jgi:hypothetical protein